MSCKDEKLISIIIPVYNVAKYLPRCIESVLNQSHREFEAIFINDGSLDNSLEILQEYSKNDNRIKIIDKKNEGSGEARNRGLRKSKGKYISFIDSDDWVDRDYLRLMYEEMENSDSDMIMCNPIMAYDDENKNKNLRTGKFSEINLKKNPEKIVDILGMPVLWNKLYKNKIIEENEINFSKLIIGEDLEFLYRVILNSKKISKVEKNLYFYYQNVNSITKSKFNEKKLNDIFYVLDKIERILTDKISLKYFDRYKVIYIYGALGYLDQIKDIDIRNRFLKKSKNKVKQLSVLNILGSIKNSIIYILLLIKLRKEGA